MRLVRILKPSIFLYECFRFFILILIFLLVRSNPFYAPWASPFVIYLAPAALFPLMALFLWLNTDRYRAYLPLLAAGKVFGLFILLGWSIVSRQGTMIHYIGGIYRFLDLMLCGDLIALAAVLVIIRKLRKIDREEK